MSSASYLPSSGLSQRDGLFSALPILFQLQSTIISHLEYCSGLQANVCIFIDPSDLFSMQQAEQALKHIGVVLSTWSRYTPLQPSTRIKSKLGFTAPLLIFPTSSCSTAHLPSMSLPHWLSVLPTMSQASSFPRTFLHAVSLAWMEPFYSDPLPVLSSMRVTSLRMIFPDPHPHSRLG